MKFKDRLRSIVENNEPIPSSYIKYGNKIVVRHREVISPNVGMKILEIVQNADGVFQHISTRGELRKPLLIHLAGESNTIVKHKENNVKYNFDLSQQTFSAGNRCLRELLVEEVNATDRLLDMFACVGNLSLQPLVHKNCSGILVEKSKEAFSFLKENISENNIKLKLINLDSRLISVENWATKIFMGYHNLDYNHLSKAVNALDSEGNIYLHPLSSHSSLNQWLALYNKWFKHLQVSIKGIRKLKVKPYSPNINHYMLVYTIVK